MTQKSIKLSLTFITYSMWKAKRDRAGHVYLYGKKRTVVHHFDTSALYFAIESILKLPDYMLSEVKEIIYKWKDEYGEIHETPILKEFQYSVEQGWGKEKREKRFWVGIRSMELLQQNMRLMDLWKE